MIFVQAVEVKVLFMHNKCLIKGRFTSMIQDLGFWTKQDKDLSDQVYKMYSSLKTLKFLIKKKEKWIGKFY